MWWRIMPSEHSWYESLKKWANNLDYPQNCRLFQWLPPNFFSSLCLAAVWPTVNCPSWSWPGVLTEPATLCVIALSQTLGEMLVVRGPTISIISQRLSRLNYQHGCVQTGAQLITLGWSPCCLCPRSAMSQLTTWRFIGANGSTCGNNSKKLSSSALPFLTLSAPSGVAVTGQTHFIVRCMTLVPPLVGMLRCALARLLLMIIAFFILGNQWGPLGDAQTCSVAPFFFICTICARISILVGASGWEFVSKTGW